MPALASAAAVGVAGAIIVAGLDLGPLSAQMALHVALMNVAAPLLALTVFRAAREDGRAWPFWAATGSQIALMWAWHAPPLHQLAMTAAAWQAAMHASLFLAALWFWSRIVDLAPRSRWQGILGLLLTGKLACLLAALFVFAPRTLFTQAHAAHHGADNLADQQVAGLLMIAACPLSYVVAGLVLAAQMLADMRMTATAPGRTLRAQR